MNIDQIESEIKEFLQEDFPNPGVDLVPTTNLLEDWFVDSFGILNTILFLEEHFGIEVERADMVGANFKDIESLSRFISRNLEKKV